MALSPGSRGWRCQPHALVCELASTSPEPKYLLHIFWVPELTWDFTATEMVTLRMPVAGCQWQGARQEPWGLGSHGHLCHDSALLLKAGSRSLQELSVLELKEAFKQLEF